MDTPPAVPSPSTTAAVALAAVLLSAGITHLVAPRLYEPLIPPVLGRPGPWVIGSGVAEIACGVAVAIPASRRAGGLASAALLVAVFPGNVVMALDAARPARWRVVTWSRLPLQVPLVLWALRVARTGRPAGAAD